MPSPAGKTLHPKCCLHPFGAGADLVSVRLHCPQTLCMFFWSVGSASWLWPVPRTVHFSRTPTPHLLPLFPADYLIFLRKMRSSDESSLNASLPNFSAFLPRTVSMFCESPVLCEMNGGTHFLKSFSDPKLEELCLNKSNTTFKIIDSHTLLLYSTLSSEDIK